MLMSWSELERLVEEAETEPALRRALGHSRTLKEFLLVCRHLGYGIDAADLSLARRLEAQEQPPIAG
jgi:hypothetical protein